MGVTAYKVTGEKSDLTILVESETAGNVPRDASREQVQQAAQEFQDALRPLAAVASALKRAVADSGAHEVSLDFGVELGGKAGFFKIVEASGKANFKVHLKWAPA